MEKASEETKAQLLKLAKRRVILKRTIKWHIIIYVIINVLLCVIYGLTTPNGYFWPMWSIIGWGVGLIMHVVVIGAALSSARNNRDSVEKEYQMLQKEFRQKRD